MSYSNWKGLCGFFCSRRPLKDSQKLYDENANNATTHNLRKYGFYAFASMSFLTTAIGTGFIWYCTGMRNGLVMLAMGIAASAASASVAVTCDTVDYAKRMKIEQDEEKFKSSFMSNDTVSSCN